MASIPKIDSRRFTDLHMTENQKLTPCISLPEGPIRLSGVEGYNEKKNDIILYCSTSTNPSGCVVYFGGDMQDYKERMLLHRDSKECSNWDLETTATLLHQHFPNQVIIVVKPAKMSLVTFSCFENFVSVNNFGAPTYENNCNSLLQLRSLLKNIPCSLEENLKRKAGNLVDILFSSLILIGFSKGSVVLNQLVYSFHSLVENLVPELQSMVRNISDMYWLDGGHSGSSNTWVIEKPVLESFSHLGIAVHIHVTPFQICDLRPRVGKEERKFRDILSKMNVKVSRKFHFESDPRSLEKHFQVLSVFKASS